MPSGTSQDVIKAVPNKKFKQQTGPRHKLVELPMNPRLTASAKNSPRRNGVETMDSACHEDTSLEIKIELLDAIEAKHENPKEFIINNLGNDGDLSIYGWSNGRYIPQSLYEEILTSEVKIRRLTLRGRGLWDSCRCPKVSNKHIGEQIDTITEENRTTLEEINIMQTFKISACALIDLISRSPKLKRVRFYGVLTKDDHHEAFQSVRFLSELDGLYWPWCVKNHIPVIRTIAKRNETIEAFYSTAGTACDLLAADVMPNLKYLSLLLNDDWECRSGKTKKASRHLKKVAYLSHATKLEALELRTFDLELSEDNDPDLNTSIQGLYENYQLLFWEHVARLKKLKHLSIYGAWELDKVSRELARHEFQIEYLKINLMPASLLPAVDAREEGLVLSMVDSIKQLSKLANLRSLWFICHENLLNVDSKTVTALKELSDIIWKLDLRISYTDDVEELLNNILRRGMHQGRYYEIKVLVESANSSNANFYIETVQKFSSNYNLTLALKSLAEDGSKARFGTRNHNNFFIWGIEQHSNQRDKTSFEQTKKTWEDLDEVFYPFDMFI